MNLDLAKTILINSMEDCNLDVQEAIKTIINALESPKTATPKRIDDSHVEFDGKIYGKNKANGYYEMREALHVAIYKYFNDMETLPEGYVVHHNGKDENGEWDKEQNDIEHLVLMSKADHAILHHSAELMNNQAVDFICSNCGKAFKAKKHKSKNRFCSKKCSSQWHQKEIESGKYDEPKKCEWCGKEFITFRHNNRKYCSKECLIASLRDQREKGLYSPLPKNPVHVPRQKGVESPRSNFWKIIFIIYDKIISKVTKNLERRHLAENLE